MTESVARQTILRPAIRRAICAGLYLLGPVLGYFAYAVTRGTDGELIMMFWLFGASAVVYVVALPLATSRAFSFHSLFHLVEYGFFCVLATRHTHLEEMAGMLPGLIDNMVLGMVVAGAVVNAVVHYAFRKTRGRESETLGEGPNDRES